MFLFASCSSYTSEPQLPRLEKKASRGELIPAEYLCSRASVQESPDPKLTQEIQTFLEQIGMLAGFPWGAGL
jgi:hypothetical protein